MHEPLLPATPAAASLSRPYLLAKPPTGPGTLMGVAPETSLWGKVQHYVLGM